MSPLTFTRTFKPRQRELPPPLSLSFNPTDRSFPNRLRLKHWCDGHRLRLICVLLLVDRVVLEEPFGEVVYRILRLDGAHLDKPFCEGRDGMLQQVVAERDRPHLLLK